MRVWFDIDNAPHAHVLAPFIQLAADTKCTTIISARKRPEIQEICRLKNMTATTVGFDTPRHLIGKILCTVWRSLLLCGHLRRQRIAFSISSSRSCALASKLLGIPAFVICDFEHAALGLFAACNAILVAPRIIPLAKLESHGFAAERIMQFDGLKEEFYLPTYPYQARDTWGHAFDPERPLAVIRPESNTAHYRTGDPSYLTRHLCAALSAANVQCVFAPRNQGQFALLQALIRQYALDGVVLSKPIDGPSLIRGADMVFSGGGTMIREAAVLGTPAYSFFSGEIGAIDAYLEQHGRLTFLRTREDLNKIRWKKKEPQAHGAAGSSQLAAQVWQRMRERVSP